MDHLEQARTRRGRSVQDDQMLHARVSWRLLRFQHCISLTIERGSVSSDASGAFQPFADAPFVSGREYSAWWERSSRHDEDIDLLQGRVILILFRC